MFTLLVVLGILSTVLGFGGSAKIMACRLHSGPTGWYAVVYCLAGIAYLVTLALYLVHIHQIGLAWLLVTPPAAAMLVGFGIGAAEAMAKNRMLDALAGN